MFAHRYWIWIWYGILAIGVIGFVPALQWARTTHWKNLDEVMRAFGTICTSVGMLLLLYEVVPLVGYGLLILSLIIFIFAFIWGRRLETERRKKVDPV